MQGAAVSLAKHHEPTSARFVLLNLLSGKSKDQATASMLLRALTTLGHSAEVVAADRLTDTLNALSKEIAARRAGAPATPTYVIAFGMDRAPDLRTFDLETSRQPIDALHAIWREGSQVDIHLLGWWANVRTYHDQLGMEAGGMVDAVAVLRVSNQDLLDLFGPFVTWNGQGNRVLFRDVTETTDPVVIVPFAPLNADDVSRLTHKQVLT